MWRSIFPISALLMGAACLLLGSGLLNTLLALRGSAAGFTDAALGLVMSCYFVGFLLGTLLVPDLISRVGHIRAFAFLAAACACTALLHSLWAAPWYWMLLRVATGMALVGLYTVIESWLSAHAAREQRSQVFAVYMVVNLGALALAQQLLRFDAPETPLLPFVVVALAISAAVMPVTATRLREPAPQAVLRLRPQVLFQRAPTAVAGALLSGLAMGPFWGLLPVFGLRSGLTAPDIAGLMSLGILGGALLQWPLGRASDRYDRRAVLSAIGLSAAVVALAALAPGVAASGWLPAVLFVYCGLAFAIYPICVAHLMDHLEPDELVNGSSTALLLHGLGAALGPALAGALMGGFGPGALFAWFALMQATLAGFVAWRYGLRGLPSLHPARFIPMLRTTPVALGLLEPAPPVPVSPDPDSMSRGERP